jgi:L-ascorbate metabolism protein UlaG (beta-lactamase superfamily)
MKHPIFLISAVCILVLGLAGCATPTPAPTATPVPATPTLSAATAVEHLHWFRHGSVLYHGSLNVYFDPVALEGDLPAADIILITHSHSDQWSVADLKKIIGPDTALIISPHVTTMYEQYKEELGGIEATVLAEGESTEVKGVKIEATHVVQPPRQQPAVGAVGYLVTIDNIRLYEAGDTAFFPEMANIQCDVAFYPFFQKDDVDQVVQVLPAREFFFVRTSTSGAQSFADLYNGMGLPIHFVAVGTGPYQP